MKKATVTLLSLSLFLLIGRAVGDSQGSRLYLLAWVVILILPPMYLALYKTSGKKLYFVFAYAALTFLLLIGQKLTNIQSDDLKKVAGPLLLVLQAGLWVQYYFTDRQKPEAIALGGNFAEAEAEKIRNLINDGRLEEAMEHLTAGDELSAEQQAVVSNFAYRLGEIKRKEMMGLLTDEGATVERNKIVTSILGFL